MNRIIKKYVLQMNRSRSSRPEMFCKKGVLRNFGKFAGKHLCQSFFFNKLAGLSPATLLKKRPWHNCCPMNFPKFLRTPFLTQHLWWLLLEVQNSLLKIDFHVFTISDIVKTPMNKHLKVSKISQETPVPEPLLY